MLNWFSKYSPLQIYHWNDIQSVVVPVCVLELDDNQTNGYSFVIHQQIIASYAINEDYLKGHSCSHCNAQMGRKHFQKYYFFDTPSKEQMKTASDSFALSTSAYDHILKVAYITPNVEALTPKVRRRIQFWSE